ncbi:MAG: hypothetical protein JXR83_01585 [Deltaproteobacteria bacterium]|nr:hypothetical protein [Deltaproteobacteria bacterium]
MALLVAATGGCIRTPEIAEGALLVEVRSDGIDVVTGVLDLSGRSNQRRELALVAGAGQTAFELIPAGGYTLAVGGCDATGREVARGRADDVVVRAGERTSISVELMPIAVGDGGPVDGADAGPSDGADHDADGDAALDATIDATAGEGGPRDRFLDRDATPGDIPAVDADSRDGAAAADAAVADGTIGADVLIGLWSALTPAPGLADRNAACVGHDPQRQVTVLFASSIWIPPAPTETTPHLLGVAETWELLGNGWIQRQPAAQPPMRGSCSMAYDSARGRLVLFGGSVDDDHGWLHDLDDTWAWDGVSWTHLHSDTSPAARGGAALAYDPARDRVVLFGGSAGSLPMSFFKDTWELVDGAQWVEQHPATRPDYRTGAGLAHDPAARLTLLHGGHTELVTYADTWAWDGASWSQVADAPTEPCCRNRWLTFDPDRQRFVRFEGWPEVRTREFDWVEWRDVISAEPPPPIGVDALIHDVARRRSLLINPISMPNGDRRLDRLFVYLGPGAAIDAVGALAPGFPVVRDGDAGGHFMDYGAAIAADRLGQIWVAGVSEDGRRLLAAMVWKFLPSGKLAAGFPRSLNGDCLTSSADAIACASDGTIWIGGQTRATGAPQAVAALWKLDQAGNLANGFPKRWQVAVDRSSYLDGVAIDASGEVWAAGWDEATALVPRQARLFRFSETGDLGVGFPVAAEVADNGDSQAHGVAINAAGDVYLCGSARATGGDLDAVLWRFDSSGTPANGFPKVWSGGHGDDEFFGVAIDNTQRVWLVGVARSAAGDYDLLLPVYDEAGNLQLGFPVLFDGVAHGDDAGRGIAIGSLGEAWVTGAIANAAGNGDFALWRFDDAGQQRPGFPVIRDSDAGDNSHDHGMSVTIGPFGYIWATGGSNSNDGLENLVVWRFE